MKRLEGKYALITGASRGIGAEVARLFAREGAHVILLARTIGGLGQATLIVQDLLELEAIDTLGPALADKFGGLDIFIANAAMLGTMTPLPHISASEWKRLFDLNFHANFRLIRTLDPLLKASDAGRIVLTTSHRARVSSPYLSAYAASKAAAESMIISYAAEIEKTGLRANILDPGAVDTKMLSDAYPGGYSGEVMSCKDIAPLFLKMVLPEYNDNGSIVKSDVAKAA
jgi:NAD(P)-dependent dehydrogenase (short-subunit alcohol dehydrogenase family)